MPLPTRHVVLSAIPIGMLLLAGCTANTSAAVEPLSEYSPKSELALIQNVRKSKDANQPLQERYRDLTLIDIHNHDAGYPDPVSKWGQYGIDRIVLFGDISEPSAQTTDQLAWDHYRTAPDHIYPSFAGFPIYEEEGLAIVRDKLEQGYLNIGEIAAASTYSPVVSKVAWKSEHPNDGYFPQIYELAAQYHVPILLHIDPPNGPPISHLEKALEQHPNTTIIFGHGNAYNDPSNLKSLLAKHPNLYIDFFRWIYGVQSRQHA